MVNQGGVEMRIAIIEDDEITRLELSKLLNTQGYETVLLIDFGNLTDELKQYSIELVLLDINLPYENGYEVCRKIKQVMPVPILFMFSGVCSIIRKDKARCENKKRGFFRKEWFSWQLVEKTQKEEN